MEWHESRSVDVASRLHDGDACIAARSCSAWEYIPDESSGIGLTRATRSALSDRWSLVIDVTVAMVSELV